MITFQLQLSDNIVAQYSRLGTEDEIVPILENKNGFPFPTP